MINEDFLPQPYRFVNKIVQGMMSNAMEEIGRRIERGFICNKELLLPPPSKALVVEQRVLSPALIGDVVADSRPAAAGQRSAIAHANGVTAEGFSTGELLAYSRFESTVYRRSPTVPAESAVTTVAVNAPRDANPTFAFATNMSVSVVTVDVTEQLKPGEEMTLLLFISADMLGRKIVSGLTIAPDGAFVAVALNEATEVAVFAITAEQAGQPPIALVAFSPLAAASPPLDRVRAICGFFSDKPNRPALGYHREGAQRLPLTHTLLVAWEGANVLSFQSLREYNASVALSHEAARKNHQLFAAAKAEHGVAQQQQQAGAAGKGGAKAGAAAGTKSGGKDADVTSPSPVAAVATPLFDGRRDTTLSEAITCVTFSEDSRIAAVGCRNGVVHIETSEGPLQTFRCAPHRAHTQCKRVMYVSSIFFVPGRSELVVTHTTHGSANGTMVTVIGLDASKILYKQRHLPDTTFAAVPCGQLPLVLYFAHGRMVVADKQTSNILTEVRVVGAEQWPAITPAPVHLSTAEVAVLAAAAAQDHVAAVQAAIAVGAEDIEVRWPQDKLTVISMYELVFGLYPAMRTVLGGASIESIAKLLDAVPHVSRGDKAVLAAAAPAPSGSLTATGLTKAASMSHGSTGGKSGKAAILLAHTQQQQQQLAASMTAGPTSPTRAIMEGVKKALPPSATVEERIAYVLQNREESRADRKARVKVLFDALDVTLK